MSERSLEQWHYRKRNVSDLEKKIHFYFKFGAAVLFSSAYVLYYILYLYPAALQETSVFVTRVLADSITQLPSVATDDECTEPLSEPGLVAPYALGVLWLLYGISIIVDDYFVLGLDAIAHAWKIPPDVAGATLMSLGSSAAPLFVNFIGVFQGSDVGFGTIVGAAIFNTAAVIGALPFFVKNFQLTYWTITRDSCWYIGDLILLTIFLAVSSPDVIEWWESFILIVWFVWYVIFMRYNKKLQIYFNVPPPAVKHDSTVNRDRSSTRMYLTTNHSLNEMVRHSMINEITNISQEAFDKFDYDHNGMITVQELGDLLEYLGINGSAKNVTAFELEMDTDKDGLISKKEFCVWYAQSDERLEAELRRNFEAVDVNHSESLDGPQLREILKRIGGDLGEMEIKDVFEQLAMKYVDATGNEIAQDTKSNTTDAATQAVTLEDGISSSKSVALNSEVSYLAFVEWYRNCVYKKIHVRRAESMKTVMIGNPLYPPSGKYRTFFSMLNYIFTIIQVFVLWLTTPDVRVPGREKWKYASFFMAIANMGVCSYFLVDWVELIGATLSIPSVIMGLAVLAAGAAFPGFLTALVVAMHGEYDEAMASCLGSNVYDISICLSLPWIAYMAIYQVALPVGAGQLSIAVSALCSCIVLMLIALKLNRWLLSRRVGVFFLLTYSAYMALQLAIADWGGC